MVAHQHVGVDFDLEPARHLADDIEEAARMYNAMLDVIIDGFEGQRKIKDDDWEFTTLEARQEKHYECRAAFERGMNLFVKYYDTLWD